MSDLASWPREADGRVVDAQGFEYRRYRVFDQRGGRHIAYARVIPTTYPLTCPDCGGMVEGVDAMRVRPGGKGPEPTSYRCEQCGREEPHDFGVPRVEEREGSLSLDEPRNAQPACPEGGTHAWE